MPLRNTAALSTVSTMESVGTQAISGLRTKLSMIYCSSKGSSFLPCAWKSFLSTKSCSFSSGRTMKASCPMLSTYSQRFQVMGSEGLFHAGRRIWSIYQSVCR